MNFTSLFGLNLNNFVTEISVKIMLTNRLTGKLLGIIHSYNSASPRRDMVIFRTDDDRHRPPGGLSGRTKFAVTIRDRSSGTLSKQNFKPDCTYQYTKVTECLNELEMTCFA